MAFNAPPQLMANGNIYPCRFVQVDSSAGNKCIQATANSKIVGVSQQGTNYPPIPDVSIAGYAATAGQNVELHGQGEVALIEAGGSFSPGDFLKADADGKAVVIATTGTTLQRYGAMALESSTGTGQKVRVYVLIGSERPAIA